MIGNARQHVGEPSARVDIIQLCGDDHRIHRRCPLTAAVRAREQPCFSAQGYAAQRSLGGVVVKQILPSSRNRLNEAQRFNI